MTAKGYTQVINSTKLKKKNSLVVERKLSTSVFSLEVRLSTNDIFAAKISIGENKMENETQRSLSKRLGITTLDVLKKAAELERLMNVRGCSMNLTSVSKSVICLEIAANNSQVPMNRVL